MKSVIFCCLCLFGSSAMAQNFIQNGHFDNNVDGWNGEHNDIAWVADDGVSQLGAFEIKDNFNNGGVATSGHQPIEVQAQTAYRLSAEMKVMPGTQAQGATMIINWLDENQFHVGFSDYVYSDTQVSHGQWHRVSGTFTPPENMKYAQVFLGVDTNNNGSSDFAVARYDDVRFELADSSDFAIVPAHSGSWFDVNQSGHGLTFEELGNGKAQVYWYTYDEQGKQMWLVGVGTHDGTTFTAEALVTTGAFFPPRFNTQDMQVSVWGTFELTFDGCNSGLFKWQPVANSPHQAGEMPIIRLTQLNGLVCHE